MIRAEDRRLPKWQPFLKDLPCSAGHRMAAATPRQSQLVFQKQVVILENEGTSLA
jgi:hypothetical protein